jgi:hypothetical protein
VQPNTIAYAALLIWPLVTLVLLLTLPAHRAVIWALLGGFLLLPVQAAFDFKGVPSLDKTTIPNLAAFFLALLLTRRGSFKWPRSKILNLLMICFIIGPFFTGMTNKDPISIGDRVIPAIDLYTSLSVSASNAIMLLPLILGAGLIHSERQQRDLLVIFGIAGLIYTIPVLLEIRLSPYFQSRLYNVGSGSYFIQQMRGGGWRSMGFLGHGLLVSIFLGLATMAAAGLWRARQRLWFVPAGAAVLYLLVVLLLNKSVGATVLTIMFITLLVLLKPRRFITMAMIVVTLVVVYPVMRANHFFPTEKIVALANNISPQRAESADFRFRNEDMLLARADDRSLFGWGAFARNRVFTVTSMGSAADVSVTDGTWIIAMGQYGWFGFLSLFGLLCYPIWHLFRLRKQVSTPITTALAAMLLLNIVDLVPNSSLRPMTWLLAGAVCGVAAAPQRAGARAARRLTGRTGQPATA